MAVTLFDLP